MQSAGVLLPSTIHATLGQEALGMGRIIVIGDVHGTMHMLSMLLARVNMTADDSVIFVGDLVDKGPHPLEVHSIA